MESSFKKNISIKIDNFILRDLLVIDVGKDYLSWFDDSLAKQFIYSAQYINRVDDLKKYVKQKHNDDDTILLGIFNEDEKHIGNIKYDDFHRYNNAAVMGILIGDPQYRGQGLAGRVIKASSHYLYRNGIKVVYLGIESDNQPALSAYQKIGFEVSHNSPLPNKDGRFVMELKLSEDIF